jgi:hypothetical protein
MPWSWHENQEGAREKWTGESGTNNACAKAVPNIIGTGMFNFGTIYTKREI